MKVSKLFGLHCLLSMLLAMVPKRRKLSESFDAMIDIGVVLMVGIAFVGMMVVAYIVWTIRDQLITETTSAEVNASIEVITTGFDDAVSLLLIAITIFILAIAISALLMLRGKQE